MVSADRSCGEFGPKRLYLTFEYKAVHALFGCLMQERARFHELTAPGLRPRVDERQEWDRMAAIMNILCRRGA